MFMLRITGGNSSKYTQVTRAPTSVATDWPNARLYNLYTTCYQLVVLNLSFSRHAAFAGKYGFYAQRVTKRLRCNLSSSHFCISCLEKLVGGQTRCEALATNKGPGILKRTSIKIQVTGTTMPSVTHPLLAASLAGHDAFVEGVDFSSNGKYIMSSSSDRTVRLWSVKDFKEKEHKYVRANVEFDHGTKVTFSPDTSEDTKQQQPVRFRAFITALANGNTIRVFKVNKKKDGSGASITGEFDFPVKHAAEIINIAVASNGKFIMSCSRDTTIILWNLKGEVLSIIDTHQMNNSFASISPCGKFVASAGFTPDVKLWSVEFTKTDDFKQVSRAMELKGHTAGVYHFSFSADSTRMATVSKDGTWKIWDIDVEFTKKQDPHLLITGIYDASFNVYDNMLIHMSPDAYVTAITMGRSVGIFNTENGHLEELLEDVHGDTITAIAWHPSSRYLATAGGDDRVIRVWHNAAGIKVQIEDLEGRLYRSRNENVKERLEQQILEARTSLDKLNIIG